MNREDIIRMAREAGIRDCTCNGEFGCLERFAALVAAAERNRTWTQEHWTEYERNITAAEREACAKFVEEKATGYEERAAQPKDVRDINPEVARIAVLACGQLAAAIRARGQA